MDTQKRMKLHKYPVHTSRSIEISLLCSTAVQTQGARDSTSNLIILSLSNLKLFKDTHSTANEIKHWEIMECVFICLAGQALSSAFLLPPTHSKSVSCISLLLMLMELLDGYRHNKHTALAHNSICISTNPGLPVHNCTFFKKKQPKTATQIFQL